MIRRPPRSTLDRSSAASDVYKRQGLNLPVVIGAPDEASVRVYVDPAASVKALARRCLEWTRAIFDRKRSVPRGKDVTLPLSE